jgi:hypothetical protein
MMNSKKFKTMLTMWLAALMLGVSIGAVGAPSEPVAAGGGANDLGCWFGDDSIITSLQPIGVFASQPIPGAMYHATVTCAICGEGTSMNHPLANQGPTPLIAPFIQNVADLGCMDFTAAAGKIMMAGPLGPTSGDEGALSLEPCSCSTK